ncbi:hypothetical protein TeGR_g14308, partial [Tetraparma gracilis]
PPPPLPNPPAWDISNLSQAGYELTFDPRRPDSVEILATVAADGSAFLLQGSATLVRSASLSYEMPTDSTVVYVDTDGSEKEYAVAAVYQEAASMRSAYCTSLIAAATALQTQSGGGTTGSGRTTPRRIIADFVSADGDLAPVKEVEEKKAEEKEAAMPENMTPEQQAEWDKYMQQKAEWEEYERQRLEWEEFMSAVGASSVVFLGTAVFVADLDATQQMLAIADSYKEDF